MFDNEESQEHEALLRDCRIPAAWSQRVEREIAYLKSDVADLAKEVSELKKTPKA